MGALTFSYYRQKLHQIYMYFWHLIDVIYPVLHFAITIALIMASTGVLFG
jgi:hypothetical protein